jgi:ketosteroid isomerase-like protein
MNFFCGGEEDFPFLSPRLKERSRIMQKHDRSNMTFLIQSFLFIFLFFPQATQAQRQEDLIIAREKAALDRWKNGDTFGFVENAAEEITYFDPNLEKRIDGIKEFRDYLGPAKGTFKFPDYELLNPKVQLHGDVGILTFNFVSRSKDGKVAGRWNATEVYCLTGGEWKLASSHWSLTKPEPRPAQ